MVSGEWWKQNLIICFLQLKHEKLDVFQFSRSFVDECYRLTKDLPARKDII